MNVRPIAEADLEPVVRLLAHDEELLFGRPSRIGLGDLREWTSETDLATDSWLHEDEDGIAAAGWIWRRDELADAIGVVAPRAKGRGLGRELVGRSEARAREAGVKRMHAIALAPDTAAAALFGDLGYRDVRHFYDMAIELAERPSPPAGVEVETFREEGARAFHTALDEAFQDHWEHHGRPFEEWWEQRRTSPGYDPSLWFLVRDDGEIAAVARNEPNRNGGGYVGALGVRRAYRGRGYAKALLLHTFASFHDRGVTRVTLGVDAESPTGATHLYERVGMCVEAENVVWEKMLT